jgi:hypothetical protein
MPFSGMQQNLQKDSTSRSGALGALETHGMLDDLSISAGRDITSVVDAIDLKVSADASAFDVVQR